LLQEVHETTHDSRHLGDRRRAAEVLREHAIEDADLGAAVCGTAPA
jgi:hypothetical protein